MSEKRRDSKGRILRNGESQRKDGKYMYRYTDSSGERKTVYSWKLVATDKLPSGKKCEGSLREIEDEIFASSLDGIKYGDADKITIDMAFASFIRLRKDLKVTTRNNYICLYDVYIKPNIGKRFLGEVKYSDIQKMYIEFAQERNLKYSTIQSIHSIIHQLFEYAVRDDILKKNPSHDVLKTVKKQLSLENNKRHALTAEQQSRLIEYVKRSNEFNKWSLLLTVLLGTGMRIGEALGLRWCDCDFKKSSISVNHTLIYRPMDNAKYEYHISTPKTSAGYREIPMLSDVKKALMAEKKAQMKRAHSDFSIDDYTGFIFLNGNGKAYTPSYIWEVIQNIVYGYNKEEYFKAKEEKREPVMLPKISAHIFRHTFCTRLCENESNLKIIQDVMGHKNIHTTMDTYNEATAEEKHKSFDRIDGKIKIA